MATFYPSPGFRAPSGNPSLSPRRTSERPKGSLPTYSRPQLFRQSFPHAVRPNRFPKSTPRSREVEAMLAVKYRGVDERIADFWHVHQGNKEVLKDVQDTNRRAQEKGQDNIIFFRNLVERGQHAEQQVKKARQETNKHAREFYQPNRVHQGDEELAKEFRDSQQRTLETRSYVKERQREIHEMQTAYRDRRREDRRAGLR
ncbi:hypothetical protein EVG20_g5233 [Dentipellis fragilis]|uniref:Uncharacterized protein n=1 Tax=Dentipellis fragilis TaxID=205917 RepID=A0A4Y9YXK5_9AGAM|nr:hypothetical protein EVG20_g5233 [Dentipellis fragilis]